MNVTEWRGRLYLVTRLPIGHGTLLMPEAVAGPPSAWLSSGLCMALLS